MALSRFFKSIPWFVSPVRVPCHQCSRDNRRGPISCLCRKCDDLVRRRLSAEDPVLLFKEENESPSIQLFYDLWFVAVLSACTTTHEVTDRQQLATYLGFFTLMWFTWFGTILFDVRFAFDSWFIRLSKACSLAIMALFAMTLVPFHLGEHTFGHDLQKLGTVLMVSRLCLDVQYAVVMIAVQVRHPEKRLIWPFIATIATTFIAAVIFGGTYREDTTHPTVSLVIWLTTSAVEAAVLLFLSCQWKAMSFGRTNLVERMGALTLIVMGEGILGMTESISAILKTSPMVSDTTIGVSIAVMLTCYSIWILYFDHTDTVGEPAARITRTSPRRQIWAFLHFPLHVAILMTLRGCAALMAWWVAVEALTFRPLQSIFNLGYEQLPSNLTTLTGADIYLKMELALNQTIERYSGITSWTSDMEGDLDSIKNLGSLSNVSARHEAWRLAYKIADDIFGAICSALNLVSSDDTGTTLSSRILQVFTEFEGIWFVTLFVAAGCTLIALAVLRYVGLEEGPIWPSWLRNGTVRRRTESYEAVASATPNETRSQKGPSKSLVAVAVHVLIGVALATVAFMERDANYDRFANYIISPWMIPTVLLTYLLGKLKPVTEWRAC